MLKSEAKKGDFAKIWQKLEGYKMHLLPNFAIEVDKTFEIFEDLALESKNTQYAFMTKESGASHLVRTAAKAVHPHGSDEAGLASEFISFLKGKGRNLKMVTQRE